MRTVGKIEVANMKKDDGTYVDRTEVFNPGGTSNNRGKVFGPDFAPRDLASLVGKPGIMEVDGTKYEIKVRMASKTELQGLNLNGVPGAPRLNVFQAQGESVRVGVVEDLKWPLSKMGVMDENFSNYGTDKPMSRNERTSTELTKFYYNLDTGALIGGGGGMGGGKTNQEAKPK